MRMRAQNPTGLADVMSRLGLVPLSAGPTLRWSHLAPVAGVRARSARLCRRAQRLPERARRRPRAAGNAVAAAHRRPGHQPGRRAQRHGRDDGSDPPLRRRERAVAGGPRAAQSTYVRSAGLRRAGMAAYSGYSRGVLWVLILGYFGYSHRGSLGTHTGYSGYSHGPCAVRPAPSRHASRCINSHTHSYT